MAVNALTLTDFRPADADGLKIVVTSEDSIEFAHTSLTKGELGLGQEIHEIREYKNYLGFARPVLI